MSIKISLRKTSLVDYPGRVSSVLFLPGCDLRCPWCHNRELVTGRIANSVGMEDALAHIRKRRPVLGGVVLSGGEPCLWDGLPELVAEIKKTGLPVKIDTNGMRPAMLEKTLGRDETRPDYIALDLKIAPARYAELLPASPESGRGAGKTEGKDTSENSPKVFSPGEALIKSAGLIRESGVAHEYRTIALPRRFITEKDIEALAPLADGSPWRFRPFRGGNCLDQAWDSPDDPAASRALAKALAEKARKLGKNGIAL